MKKQLLCATMLISTALWAQDQRMAPSSLPPAPQSATPDIGAKEERLGQDIVDLYEQAVAYLESITDDYRRIKAIQLAKTRDIAFSEAYDNISTVMPVLQEINKPLLRKDIRNPADIQQHKHEVERVEKEVEMMIELAAKLLLEIEVVRAEMAAEAEAEKAKTLEEIVQQQKYDPDAVPVPPPPMRDSQQYQSLEEAAQEDPTQVAKDLTPLMQQAMRQNLPDIKDLTSEQESKEKPVDLFNSSDAISAILGPVDLAKLNRMQGRKVQSGGEPVEWMFVDTWYTIGPFPNPARVNINRKFPPETVVDFDATYPGKNGKLVRWKFVQAGQPMVIPADDEEYAIYYAYTEIYLDRPMNLWLAVGSDDKANVWLNGMPIWISGDQLKGWKVNEGLRKVTLQAGRNRILYRVENGWNQTAFSLGIRTSP